MVVEKVINNNIVSAFDETGSEVVVMGRGIGFGIKPGTEIEMSRIEKTFRIENRNVADRFKELLTHMPLEHVNISNDIISYAKEHLNLNLNQSIYVTLTDHINFAIKRYENGIIPQNALLWEIKRFYRQEYELGKFATQVIWERLHIALPDDEAGFIALHFVNAQYGATMKDTLKFPNLLKDVLKIVSDEFAAELDEDSLHYERLVTHVKFLLQRIYRGELLNDTEAELTELIRNKYPEEYRCGEKIGEYIESITHICIPREELLYLAIHIRRVTM